MTEWKGSTIEDRLITSRFRPSGFDYMRFILATSIIAFHAPGITQDSLGNVLGPLAGVAFKFLLPMFFSLSGFLVAGSLERNASIIGFYTLRALRIVPALAVEITLSALILGPVLTTVPLTEYFSAPEFRSYFLNIIGYMHYRLPGVFHSNPFPDIVNQQLWTVPSELNCYLALGALAVASLVRRRIFLLLLIAAGQVIWANFAWNGPSLVRAAIAPGGTLILAFICGVAFYRYKDLIRMSWPLFLGITAATLFGATLPQSELFLSIPVCDMTVFLGLLNPHRHKFIASGDYSYGLFLYGYPIQQVMASTGSWAQHWWLNLILAYPVALLIAIISWHKIEKPALGLRKAIPAMERAIREVFKTEPLLSHTQTGHVHLTQLALRLVGAMCAGATVLLLINASDFFGEVAATATFVAFAGASLTARIAAFGAPASIGKT